MRAEVGEGNVPFVVAHANDWMGYAVSPEEYARGGYEACMSFFGPDFGPWLVDEAVRTAERVWPGGGGEHPPGAAAATEPIAAERP